MEHQVFISYANEKGGPFNKDRHAADMICHALESENIKCWMAHRNIPHGEKWPAPILDAVENSKIVVLVFSSNANNSQWVKDEITHALNKNIKIIPFRIEEVPPVESLRYVELRFQWLDAFTPPLEEHINILVKDVRSYLVSDLPPGKPTDLPPNPFIDTVAIKDPARFIGREAELRLLREMLRGASVVLLGEPTIGKSSLLWHLAYTWDGKVIGPLDCQELENRDDFYWNIAEALHLDRCDWRTIRQTLKSSRILFLLDEMDVGPVKGLTIDDLAFFRSVCNSTKEFKMVTVSHTPLKEVFPYNGRGSPAYSFLLPFILTYLTENEARLLLSHPWAPNAPVFDTETCNRLLKSAGYHPYKLQRAAFHRYESMANPAYDWHSAFQNEIKHL